MRLLAPQVNLMPAGSGDWVATVVWVDEGPGTTGELLAGPHSSPIAAVTALQALMHDVGWLWVSWAGRPVHPRVVVPELAADTLSELTTWAGRHQWAVDVLPVDNRPAL